MRNDRMKYDIKPDLLIGLKADIDMMMELQKQNPEDEVLQKVCSIILPAEIAAYDELTKNDPTLREEIALLTGNLRPSVVSQYIEAPASILMPLIKALFLLKPSTTVVLQRDASLFRLFKRKNNKLTLLASTHS